MFYKFKIDIGFGCVAYFAAKAKEGERIEASAMNEFLAAEAGSTAGVSQTDQPRKSAPKRKSIRMYMLQFS